MIKAFTYHKVQIMTTFLLEIIFVYIFSIFAYYYINQTFYNYEVTSIGENLCIGVWHCFTTVFSLGPRSTGSIGEVILRQSYAEDNQKVFYVRFFYDMITFIILNVCFLNMIAGVIIDTFAELRDEKHQTDEKKRNMCYVCSISRNTVSFAV